MKPAIRLDETVCVGRLDTLAQVLALLESLDDLGRAKLAGFVIVSRQTRREPERTKETTKERSVVL